VKAFFYTLLLIAVAGCASTPSKPESLEDRIADKWNLLVAGEYAKAYEYYSPGYRSVTTVESFIRAMSSRTIPWLDARVRDVGPCEPETCNARVELDFSVQPRVPGAKVFESTKIVRESWIRQNNAWFFVPKQ